MKKSKNNNIILGFGYWVFEFGFSWCKGKVIWFNWFFVTPYFIQNKIQTYFKTENMYYLPSFDRVTVFYLVYYIRKCTFRWLEKRSLITMDKKGSLKQLNLSELTQRFLEIEQFLIASCFYKIEENWCQ